MAHWKDKCCPRCGGDLFMDMEESDWFAQCLQCGFAKNNIPLYEVTMTLPVGRPLRTSLHARDLKYARAS